MTEPAALVRTFRPTYFWAAQIFSWAGTSLQAAIIPLWLYALVGSAQLALGGFVLDALSRTILGPLAGGLVARLTPRNALILTDLVGACVALGAAAVVTGPKLVAVVYVMVPMLSMVLMTSQIAFQSLVPQLVAEERLSTVNGRYQTALSLMSVVMPAIGALAAAAVNWRWLVAANGVSFLVSMACNVWALPFRRSKEEGQRSKAPHPLTHLASNARRALRGKAGQYVLVEASLFAAFGGSQSLLFGFALEEGQKQGSATLAALLLASGVGMILGGFVLQRLGDSPRMNMLVVGLLSALGPILIVAGVLSGLILAAVLGAALIGASGNLLIGGITVVVQKSSLESDRPATLGFRKGVSSLSQLFCYFWTLALASSVGYAVVYPLAGAVACLAAFTGVALISRRTP